MMAFSFDPKFDPKTDIDDLRRIISGRPYGHIEYLLKAQEEKVLPVLRGTGERILPKVRVKMGRAVAV